MNSKTLIIYVTHEISENLLFFCRNGYIDDPKYDFVFVFNNPNLKIEFVPKKTNIKVVNRENIGIDFGGWTHVLHMKDEANKCLYENYDYFVLINSTVRGPFLPIWYDQKQDGYWPELFKSKLNNNIKLVGTTINATLGLHSTLHSNPHSSRPVGPHSARPIGPHSSRPLVHHSALPINHHIPQFPHVQSMFLVFDRIGLDIGINKRIFDPQNIDIIKQRVIMEKEIGFSKAIVEAGYNIASILPSYNNVDFRNPIGPFFQKLITYHCAPNGHFGCNINPFEVIFFKSNVGITPQVLKNYTEWNTIKKSNLIDIIKISYGISENESIDITQKFKDHLVNSKLIINTKFNMNKHLLPDPYFGKLKKIFITCRNGQLIVINESHDLIEPNIILLVGHL